MLGLQNRGDNHPAGSWPARIAETELLGGWALSHQHLPITADVMLPLHVNTESVSLLHAARLLAMNARVKDAL